MSSPPGSLITRSVVLVCARVLNQALALFSPLVLVRLLEISEYGRYRQFTVTAMFITAMAGFALSSNLNYLIARSPQRAAVDVTNACLLMLAAAAVGATVVIVGRGLLVPAEIADAWPLLAVYVMLFLNMEVLVSYWLAHGRSDRVMYYTLSITALRLSAVIGAAVFFQDVTMIFVTMVCAEALKALALYLWLRRRGLLVFRWDGAAIREQWRLALPLGTGSVLYKLNESLGKVVVGNQLGAVPLAIYTTAAYQVPLVSIVQGALADVIFPDMVKRSQNDPLRGLQLWKRANVLVFGVICPAWVLLTYYAEPLIRLLFTDAYAAAAPYFQVFLLLMVRQCFLFSTPLRSVADNASFARANTVALAINVGLILALIRTYGLWAPTLGLLIGQTWTSIYLGRQVMRRYGIPLAQVCHWPKLGLVLSSCLVALGALHALETAWPRSLAGTAAGLGAFALLYLAAARVFLREEYEYIVRELVRRFRGRACQSARQY